MPAYDIVIKRRNHNDTGYEEILVPAEDFVKGHLKLLTPVAPLTPAQLKVQDEANKIGLTPLPRGAGPLSAVPKIFVPDPPMNILPTIVKNAKPAPVFTQEELNVPSKGVGKRVPLTVVK